MILKRRLKPHPMDIITNAIRFDGSTEMANDIGLMRTDVYPFFRLPGSQSHKDAVHKGDWIGDNAIGILCVISPLEVDLDYEIVEDEA